MPKYIGFSPYVSTHSRLKAAGWPYSRKFQTLAVSTHSRLKAAGLIGSHQSFLFLFQHTAA